MFLSALLFIRRKTASKQSTERPDNTAQLNDPSAPAPDELYYASIRFSKNQEDPLYSNIGEAQPNRHKNEEEEEEEQEGAVEYTLVNFKRASPGLRLQDAAEDSAALYSTVTKKPRIWRQAESVVCYCTGFKQLSPVALKYTYQDWPDE